MQLNDADLDALLGHLRLGTRATLDAWGVRDVSGANNSLLPGLTGLGSADTGFRLVSSQTPSRAADVVPAGLPPGVSPVPPGTPTAYDNNSTFVVDYAPREISNLISAEPVPTFSAPQVGVTDGLPTSKLHTLFGQFFTHDMDLVSKGANGLVYVPLLPGDPLYVPGGTTNYMVLSRANFTVGSGGLREYDNQISSWIDMNVTYGTHPSMTALLKEYDASGVATGKLLQHADVVPAMNNGMPWWSDVKANALRIGLALTDQDVLNLPQVRLNADGTLYRNGMGMAEFVVQDGSVVRTGHALLDDMARRATPSPGLLPDVDTLIGGSVPAGFYDDDLLAIHFIAGDGRANENYPLTSVHGIFHEEHSRVFGELQALVNARGAAFASQWSGEMLFEATKLVVEAEYRHIAFDEYARRLTPNLDAFASYAQDALTASISTEFAHAVFRFGHTQTAATFNNFNPSGSFSSPLLVDTFLRPGIHATLEGNNAGLGSVVYTTAELAAVARSRAFEVDEFFTDGLRNTLFGLPLDLTAINIARGRDMGLPSLNALRAALFGQTGLAELAPYTSWADFGSHLLNPSSLKNFVMAYAGSDLVAYQSTFDAAGWAQLRATDWQAYKAALGVAADAALADPGFIGIGGNQGFQRIDLYVGGLAESKVAGGMLGSTFDFVTAVQLAALRNNDRLDAIDRLFGTDLVHEIRSTSLADLIRANVIPVAGQDAFNTARTRIHGEAFAVVDATIEVGNPFTWSNPSFALITQTHTSPTDPRIGAGWSLAAGVFSATSLSEIVGGTAGADHVLAGQGSDTVYGDGGDDTLEGQGGRDWLYGGEGGDNLAGNGDNDTLHGQTGNDTLAGGAGNDTLSGGAGQDALFGDADADYLVGGVGQDMLAGGDGSDELAGGEGSDTLIGGAGNDTLDGGSGTDVATYAGARAGHTIQRVDATVYAVVELASGATDRLSGVETLQFGDQVVGLTTGTVAVNDSTPVEGQLLSTTSTLEAPSGVTVTGYRWQQSDGIGGWQDIAGALSANFIATAAQTGRHLRVGVSFNDAISSGALGWSAPTAGVAPAVGNSAPTGGVSLSSPVAQVGDAVVATSTVVDADGMPGALRWRWQGSADGQTWTDVVDNAPGRLVVTAAQAGLQLRAVLSYVDGLGKLETVVSPATAAVPAVGLNLIAGTSGNNNLAGTAGADRIDALAGNDTVDGGAGADVLVGGSGHEIYLVDHEADAVVEAAGQGGDEVRSTVSMALGPNVEALVLQGAASIDGWGNGLNNWLFGNGGANRLDGGGGNDYLTGGAGADTLLGGAGDDILIADHAGDVVVEHAGEGVDEVRTTVTTVLWSQVEKLTLQGGAAINGTGNELDNVLVGNGAANVLQGGAGQDTIRGGAGRDMLSGGEGADLFVWVAVADSGTAQATRDIVNDFLSGMDRIDLSAIDAVTAAAGDQAFTALGEAASFTGQGQLAYFYANVAGVEYTVVHGNVDANLSADFQIAVVGHHAFMDSTTLVL